MRPEVERFVTEHGVRHDELNRKHDAESAELRAEFEDGLDLLGVTDGQERLEAFLAMVDEAFPAHNSNRHRFWQENPGLRRGRREWYEAHPEFKDGFADHDAESGEM